MASETVKDVSERLDAFEADTKQRLDAFQRTLDSMAEQARTDQAQLRAELRDALDRLTPPRDLSAELVSNALAAIDDAVRADRAHDGPPGSGLHRVLAAAVQAHFGITAPSFDSSPPELVTEPQPVPAWPS